MRRGRLGSLTILLVLVGTLGAGCTTVVEGSGAAAPSVPATTDATTPTTTAPPSGTAGPRSGLDVDPVADECLLNASELGALVGGSVQPPEQDSVARADGSTVRSCVAMTGGQPVAMINVYRVRSGTPADYVRAAAPGGRRDLDGVGQAAAVFDTSAGPTLQLAGADYLVTILVAGSSPTDDAWRTAATAALSRLPA